MTTDTEHLLNRGRTFANWRHVRTPRTLKLCVMAALAAALTTDAAAQTTPLDSLEAGGAGTAQSAPASSRQGAIEEEQAAKATKLRPYTSGKVERIFRRIDTVLEGGTLRWHPFLDSAYNGGGFTLGVGHATYVSGYNYVDLRGSYSIMDYKRAEAEFVAPRLFDRRARLSVIGGWREATQVGFYGTGPDTSLDDRTNYLFQRPYGSALFTIFPARKILMLRGGVEFTQWSQKPGEGSYPSVEERYTPATLPGLGAKVNYVHTQGTVGLDWRTSPEYSRRGAFLGATLHDYKDGDQQFGFQMAEYEGIAHVPILRESWVLSFRGRVQTTFDKGEQQIPFFMLPALGGGSTLRAYSSWRFRDQNSLLLQGEWRIMVNRYLDLAFFYDAGKVAARRSDLDFDGLKDDYGVGLRFHGPLATPLRIELASGREARLNLIFSTSAAF
jgi:surface antigen Omp85-like protein